MVDDVPVERHRKNIQVKLGPNGNVTSITQGTNELTHKLEKQIVTFRYKFGFIFYKPLRNHLFYGLKATFL